MTYRAAPRPNGTQCPACGASVGIDAAFCPECGATQPPQLPPPTDRRSRTPLAIAAGAIAAVLGGAVLGIVLLGPRTDAVADESPGLSPSASAAPSASAEDNPSPSASADDRPSASPTPATVAIIPNLGIAEVTTDALNLRAAAKQSSESLAMLEPGRRLFIIGQPTDAGDLRWYRVAPFDDAEGCESGCGLLGFVATPMSASEDAWIEEVDVSCPTSPMTAQQIGALVPLEALHCYGNNEIVVTGTVDNPIHGPYSPLVYTPGWLNYENIQYLQHAGWMSYRPHPSAGLEMPERGEVVRVTGHFEDPAATDCRVTVDPGFFGGEVPADFVAPAPNRVVLDCRAAFVWTAYEVTDVVDLGPCCGFPPEE